jgi:hypothetical protein
MQELLSPQKFAERGHINLSHMSHLRQMSHWPPAYPQIQNPHTNIMMLGTAMPDPADVELNLDNTVNITYNTKLKVERCSAQCWY